MTRPEPGAAATARALCARGLRPVVVPFLAIRPLACRLPEHAQAVLATSGNALAEPLPALHAVPLFAVGDATASRAQEAGFREVASAGADARALAELVAARCDPASGPLLLLAGRGHGSVLAANLRGRGFSVLRRAVYASLPVTEFPSQAAVAIDAGGLRAALFFSAETARAFVRTLPNRMRGAISGVDALAIAPPARAALAVLPWRAVRVALHPTQDELLALL